MGDREDVVGKIGLSGINGAYEEMRLFRANRDWAWDHLEILKERHGGKYVAINGLAVIAQTCALDILQEKIPFSLRQSSYVLYVNGK